MDYDENIRSVKMAGIYEYKRWLLGLVMVRVTHFKARCGNIQPHPS